MGRMIDTTNKQITLNIKKTDLSILIKSKKWKAYITDLKYSKQQGYLVTVNRI